MQSYRNFDLEITAPARDEAGVESLAVRVAFSGEGEQRPGEAVRVTLGAELRRDCGRLDRRELDLAGMIATGRALGDVLLPPAARELFEANRRALGDGEGMRLRLKLDTWGFADLPWEYLWLPAPGGRDAPPDATGFLALDPRLSISRYELMSEPIGALEPAGGKKLRVVAVLAAPKDERWAPLDLEGEERGLRGALAKRPEVRLEVVAEATLPNLERALLEGAEVFHFAGHGRFQAAASERVDTVAGKGFLVFRDAEGRAAEIPAETVLVNLRGRGVRLAMLGACEGARRDRINPWTGIAPALVRGGLPAVVAMQATLYDRSAVSFSTRFYEALAAGLPVDAAVTAGRVAIYNESGAGERDWGVPVLYLRAESGVLFPRNEAIGALSADEPLDRKGWLAVGLGGVVLALASLAFYFAVHPRISERWIARSGVVTLLSIGGLVLAFLQGLVGDDARRWARRLFRHRLALGALGGAALAIALALFFLVTHRPTVLRIVPGTNLATELRPQRRFEVRVWQGDARREQPDWKFELRTSPGATMGAPPAVTAAALERASEPMAKSMRDYLARQRVPDPNGDWMRLWEGAPERVEPDGVPRRSGKPVRVELFCNGARLELQPSEFDETKDLLDSWDQDFEMLFLEPVAPELCPRA